jgi:CTP synthase
MDAKGFVISGTSPDGSLAELIELRDHPYFVGCQYHPEFQSKPNKPHPLFKAFIQASLGRQSNRATHAQADQESLRRVPERELVPQR